MGLASFNKMRREQEKQSAEVVEEVEQSAEVVEKPKPKKA